MKKVKLPLNVAYYLFCNQGGRIRRMKILMLAFALEYFGRMWKKLG